MITKIPYADHAINPIIGCAPCSPVCQDNGQLKCWAGVLHNQRHEAYLKGKLQNCPQYAKPFSEIQLLPERLEELKHLKKPRTIFICSGSDLFHPDVPDEFILSVFNNMIWNPQHDYLVLTKRIKRAEPLLKDFNKHHNPENITLGISIWNQESADRDIPILLDCWKGKTWISAEPLLGHIDLTRISKEYGIDVTISSVLGQVDGTKFSPCGASGKGIDYVVAGCESGGSIRTDRNYAHYRRPCKDEWLDSIAEQCNQANVPCLIKQREINGKVVVCEPCKDFFRR